MPVASFASASRSPSHHIVTPTDRPSSSAPTHRSTDATISAASSVLARPTVRIAIGSSGDRQRWRTGDDCHCHQKSDHQDCTSLHVELEVFSRVELADSFVEEFK